MGCGSSVAQPTVTAPPVDAPTIKPVTKNPGDKLGESTASVDMLKTPTTTAPLDLDASNGAADSVGSQGAIDTSDVPADRPDVTPHVPVAAGVKFAEEATVANVPSNSWEAASGDTRGAYSFGRKNTFNFSNSDLEGESDEEGEEPSESKSVCARRAGVTVGKMVFDDDLWHPPVFPKDEEDREALLQLLRNSDDSSLRMLFDSVSEETMVKVLDAFEMRSVAFGETVATQGREGEHLYVVKSGSFNIFSDSDGASVPGVSRRVHRGSSSGQLPSMGKVETAGSGTAFGELALLYSATSSATVVAVEESVVWQLDRQSFCMLVVNAEQEKWKSLRSFLTSCSFFSTLAENELAKFSDFVHAEDFSIGETIVEQGERDDKMFLLQSGSAVACMNGPHGEVDVKKYVPGDHFGEIGMLTNKARKASVYAVEQSTCVYFDRGAFQSMLSSLEDKLRVSWEEYPEYDMCVTEKFTPSRRRTVKVEETEGQQGDILSRRSLSPAALAAAGGTDASVKTAHSIQYTAQTFEIPDSMFQCWFTIAHDRAFSDCAPYSAHFGSAAVNAQDCEGDDGYRTYKYDNSMYRMKQSSVCSVVCQKGRKPGFEPTPNQDNLFVLTTANGVDIYGVCDGHGPLGHVVSSHLVRSVPYFLTQHAAFDTDKKLAVTEAIAQAQADLHAFSDANGHDFTLSGSTLGLLILCENEIHIASVGDSRVMVSSYARHSENLVTITSDHLPDLPEEKERIERTGDPPGEVRDGRIYLQGQMVPGLNMSRAMGDFCGEELGVIQEPHYECITVDPDDRYYALVASDGVWEFMDGERVTTLSAKKLRMKGPCEAIRHIFHSSRKRWEHFAQEYCDDVSGIMVQWNYSDVTEKSKTMHTVHIAV